MIDELGRISRAGLSVAVRGNNMCAISESGVFGNAMWLLPNTKIDPHRLPTLGSNPPPTSMIDPSPGGKFLPESDRHLQLMGCLVY